MLEAQNLYKAFEGRTVINDFSYIFEDSSLTFIMGPSGSGKTTLIMMLMGLIKPDSGKILIPEGVKYSAVFQEPRLCENLSAVSNIRMVNENLSKTKALEMLIELGLGDDINKPVRDFSGGMKQRVSLLRALSATYDIIFLDEPFRGLDDETKNIVMTYFKQKTAGKTVIIVTHDTTEHDLLGGDLVLL